MSPISDELAVLRSRPTLDHLVKMVAHTDVPQRRWPCLQRFPADATPVPPATPKPWLRDGTPSDEAIACSSTTLLTPTSVSAPES
jgi:hypothetical protein